MGGRGRQISEFKTSLVYRVISRTARAIQRNPVSEKKEKKRKEKKRKEKKRKEKKRKEKKRQTNKKTKTGTEKGITFMGHHIGSACEELAVQA